MDIHFSRHFESDTELRAWHQSFQAGSDDCMNGFDSEEYGSFDDLYKKDPDNYRDTINHFSCNQWGASLDLMVACLQSTGCLGVDVYCDFVEDPNDRGEEDVGFE